MIQKIEITIADSELKQVSAPMFKKKEVLEWLIIAIGLMAKTSDITADQMADLTRLSVKSWQRRSESDD